MSPHILFHVCPLSQDLRNAAVQLSAFCPFTFGLTCNRPHLSSILQNIRECIIFLPLPFD